MSFVLLERPNDLAEWRTAARKLLADGTAPNDVHWQCRDDGPMLFQDSSIAEADIKARLVVPRVFLALAEAVICHSDPSRFSLLYRLLWRLQTDKSLLHIVTDTDVMRALEMERSVRRDCHKMKAFVRFRQVAADATTTDDEIYLAWFEPDHFIVERTAPFFARRFSNMNFIIATPVRTVEWDRTALAFTQGRAKPRFDISDDHEELWRSYYASIFNPARLKIKAMQAEMPKKYWNNLPEARLIPSMIATASRHVSAMIDAPATAPAPKSLKWARAKPCPVVEKESDIVSLDEARAQSAKCQRCDLYCHATQTVFGEGALDAQILFVGEQPGDKEDIAGRPFVGPAGQLFDDCLGAAGIDRSLTYVTNAVKHFKYVPRGKLRLHRSPNKSEVDACRFWLNLERAFIKPKLIVTLGGTAALAVTGRAQKVLSTRGQFYELDDKTPLFMTVHPSFLLRVREGRAEQERLFIEDMKKVRSFIEDDGIRHLEKLAA